MARASGFCLFETAIGGCGIAWGERPARWACSCPKRMKQPAARPHAQRAFRGVPETAPPAWRAGGHRSHPARCWKAQPRPVLDVPLDMDGVPAFHQRVYEVTRAIPPGRTMTYGEVAARLGEPGAARAVGQALGHNPFAPVVPCHRVLAAGSGAGGFSAEGGVATKLRMLQIEKAQLGSEPGLFD